jgi:hypothetical protein
MTANEMLGAATLALSIIGSLGVLIFRTGKTVAMVEKHDIRLDKLENKVDSLEGKVDMLDRKMDKVIVFLSHNFKRRKKKR